MKCPYCGGIVAKELQIGVRHQVTALECRSCNRELMMDDDGELVRFQVSPDSIIPDAVSRRAKRERFKCPYCGRSIVDLPQHLKTSRTCPGRLNFW